MGRSHSHRRQKQAPQAETRINTQQLAEGLLDRGLITLGQAYGTLDWARLGRRQRAHVKHHLGSSR